LHIQKAKGLIKELTSLSDCENWQNETHPNDEKRRLSVESMDGAQMQTHDKFVKKSAAALKCSRREIHWQKCLNLVGEYKM
jgi:hypothetical protein